MKHLLLLALLFALPLSAVDYGSDCEVSVGLCQNAVNSSKIEDGTIVDADISSSASIGITKLSSYVLQYADVTISAASLDTANATPVTVLAAPGAGNATLVDSIMCFIDFVATRAECGTCTLDFKYTDGSGAEVADPVPNATLELDSDTYYHSDRLSVVPVVNAAVVAQPDADVTAGDSIVKCRIVYRTVTISDI